MTRPSQSPLIVWLRLHPRRKNLLYLPAIAWAGLIFWFSSRSDLPTLAESWQEFIFKKTAHLLIYAGLYFWLWWATYLIKNVKAARLQALTKHQVYRLLFVLGLYAASDELHQVFTATRHPSPRDVVIDLTGASLLAAALQNLTRWPKWLKASFRQVIPS